MAEGPRKCEDSSIGQDLLSVALGESGLNLDEFSSVSSESPGNLLNQALFESGIASGLDFWLAESNITTPVPSVPQYKVQTNYNNDSNINILSVSRENGSTGLTQQVITQSPEISLGGHQPVSLNSWTQKRGLHTANWNLTASDVLLQQQSQLQSSVRQILGLSAPPISQQNTSSPIRQELSKSVVSRLWSNQEVNLDKGAEGVPRKPVKEEVEEEEEEEEELGHTETYAEYMPSKSRIGIRHPDPVVETSSLSSVTPPDVWYNLHLPADIIDNGHLSALQLEAVVYSCQQHETFLMDGCRAGFLIGDGAGVGKGRTVAGIIYENYLLGRKRAVWLSVSNDLKYDAVRDLRDIGCNISVHSLSKFKYDAKISSKANGKVKKGCIFSTYSSLIGESQGGGKYRTRLSQLLHWCGTDFDGVIILDECHKAKNLVPVGSSKPTKTGVKVLELQNKLPKARVVYCSATGASEPKNMAYMNRLGIWGPGTPFREFSDFIQAVERRGVGAMEIVAMDMKLRGMYMARQLSFGGVSFDIREVPLSPEFIEMYDAAVKLWKDARDKFEKAADLMVADSRMKKTMWGQFWSAHQRFFKYLCIASKVKTAVRIAKEAVERRKCIVIGLQSTGEARTLEQLEECGGELTDFVSTAKGVFSALVEKHYPAPDRQKMFDLFGLDVDGDSGSSRSSPVPTRKRRKAGKPKGARKKLKPEDELERLFNGGSDSDEDSDEDKLPDNKQDVTEDSSAEESDSHSEENDEDDFNPFGGSHDDDEDPWVTRSDRKKKPKNKSGPNTPEMEDPSRSALAAAGLKVSTASWSRTSSSSSLSSLTNKVNNLSWNQRSQSPANLSTVASRLAQVSSNSGSGSSISLREMYPDTSKSTLASLLSSNTNNHNSTLPSSEQCMNMKKYLLEKADILGSHLPPNTLDELIDELGGTDNVAEMTGRKGRVVSNIDGTISYESRSKTDVPLELLNIAEKKRFMDGEKNIAVISEAASSGISLQADRRAKNQRRRVHITLELPWSADRAIQQFGRTHRSNQVSAPEYLFLISELAGERRFASIVAKRLESLGALTHGDRRATESRDLSRFNIDNKYGRTALEAVLKAVMGQVQPMVSPPADYKGNFFQDIRMSLVGVGLIVKDDKYGNTMLDKDYTNISRFLNRILGIEVELQNRLFAYFCETLAAVIQQAKRSGRYDEGILDLGSAGEAVQLLKTQSFMGSTNTKTAPTELHTVSVERGLSYDQAMELYNNQTEEDDGFYLSAQVRNNKRIAILVKGISGGQKKKLYSVFRPNTGLQVKQEAIENIKKKYSKVDLAVAKQCWDDQYNLALTLCSHAYWRGNCKRQTLGLSCEVGLRQRTYHILSGSVLSVWSKLETVLAGQPGSNKIQIIRVRTVEGTRIVGSLIPSNCVPALERTLTASTQQQPRNIYHFDDIL